MAQLKTRFRLVLVGTRTPGNIGATARVASNFGCRDWVLVSPKCRFKTWGARKYATNIAREYLDEVRLVKTVKEAVEDCQIAIGFTRRRGKNRKPSIELGDIATLTQASGNRIALVFGNEETGLSTEELAACTRTCEIPTVAEAASMNLSHSTAVVLARIYAGMNLKSAKTAPSAARISELEGMLAHWSVFLRDIGIDQTVANEKMVASLRQIFARTDLAPREVRALRGMLTRAQTTLRNAKSDGVPFKPAR